MFRIYWRLPGGGPERWSDAKSRADVMTTAMRAVLVDRAVACELRLQSIEQGWSVPTTLGALARWRGEGPPEVLAASQWKASEALSVEEADIVAQLAVPLARAVAKGLIRQSQAERLREIAAQALVGVGPAGRDIVPDEGALAPFGASAAARGHG